MQLADKTVLITGASGGIGRAMASAFAEEGANLVLHGHGHFDELEEWTAQQPWSARARCARADVCSLEEQHGMFRAAKEAFGRVDVAIANAGVWPTEDLPLHELDEARMRRTLEVNLFGATWTAREFIGSLAESGPRADGHGASLLFTGSTAGHFGERDHADYSTSKAGLYGLVRSLKNEITRVDPYARVNMIEPGWTVTEMARKNLDQPGVVEGVVSTMALRQIARSEEIARAAVFFASPFAARHVSGQVLTVAGGMEGRQLWQRDDIDRAEVLRRLADDR